MKFLGKFDNLIWAGKGQMKINGQELDNYKVFVVKTSGIIKDTSRNNQIPETILSENVTFFKNFR